MIGITEPRRFCATSLAARVAEEQCIKLGSDVGYSIRFDECYSKDQTKIKVGIHVIKNILNIYILTELPI